MGTGQATVAGDRQVMRDASPGAIAATLLGDSHV